ncbi:hypothetical protein FA15DRAFT_678688 [Coprinopsis marcescibilis]|uniref:Uncharacterized protein n=1 Tax=Coprinopsis marcescibilis TaxID=230819 RepID=A0A5C3L5H2_COPMA|nr:hypothetical protein FA15DRAFT_678688 [Coprinopsis marcescibilis]
MSFKGFNPLPPIQTHIPRLSPEDVYVARPAAPASASYLREAIASIDAKIAALVSQKRELEAKLEGEVRLQSPVLRVPSELLSSIFIMGVLGMGEEDPVMVPTLMLVCRYWAEVALNTPLLWAKISVSPHDSLEKARRRIERSKSCPLEISINFDHRQEPTSNATDQIVSAIDLFNPVFRRTKSFSLNVPSRHLAHAALSRCRSEAPILEQLAIQVHYSIQEDRHFTRATLPLFNGNTPMLRSCSITSFNFGWDLNLMARLRVLKLGGYYNGLAPSATTLLSILRQCPELEEIALRNLSNVDSNSCFPTCGDQEVSLANTQKAIYLPRLTKASFYYAGIARQIMTCISCPKLEWLELCYLENVSNVIQVLYSHALTKLPLRHLRIEMCVFNELEFIGFLRRIPSLHTLELVDVEDATSSFLKALSSSQPSWICPRLDCLVLDGCTSLDWDSLRAFIESRLPANGLHTFKRFHSTTSSIISSASEAAAALARTKSRYNLRAQTHIVGQPQRLRSIDITRCPQIGKEMVQWLRMYVAEVKCESAKGVPIWGVTAS